MPDTSSTYLQSQIDSLSTNLHNKIDSLEYKTNLILNYVNEQGKNPEFRLNIVGIIGIIVLFVIIAYLVFISNKEKKWAIKSLKFLGFESDKEHIKDGWRSYRELAIWFLLVSVLFAVGLIHKFSQAELLFTIALIFTIVGAFWSVFSRIESSKAFKQSKETYNAFGDTFDFTAFFEDDNKKNLQAIYDSIKAEAEEEVSLYIGFPIVGLPYLQNKKLADKPEKLFYNLIRKIEDIKIALDSSTSKQVNCTLNIGVFKESVSEEILKNSPNISAGKKEELMGKLKEFYTLLNYFDKDSKSKNGKNRKYNEVVRRTEDITFGEKFRFVTIKDTDFAGKNSFIWVVDFKEGIDGKPRPFKDSMVFQTKEERFLNLLEGIFRNKDRFSKEELQEMGLNDRQIRAIQNVKVSGKITNSEYQTLNKCKQVIADKDLSELVQKEIFLFNNTAGAEANYQLKIQVKNTEVLQ